ncbi:MAG: hypothetical protein HUJ98_07630 [Bacteroidaceae bacterium]|nr:hypothetical protein [Bacteroidaceae bacterium]
MVKSDIVEKIKRREHIKEKKQEEILAKQKANRAQIESDLQFLRSFLYQVMQTPLPTEEVFDDSFILENIIRELHVNRTRQRFRDISVNSNLYRKKKTRKRIGEMSEIFERILRDSSCDPLDATTQVLPDAKSLQKCLTKIVALMEKESKIS